MVIGSNDLTIDTFEYSQSWLDLNAFPPPTPIPVIIYPTDLFVGGFLAAPTNGSTLIGTLIVGIQELSAGTFDIVVANSTDGGLSGIGQNEQSEGLSGTAHYDVIPEPTTLVLLGIGGLAVLRRRL